MRWSWAQTQPPAKRSYSPCFTQDCLFHSTREHTLWALLDLRTHVYGVYTFTREHLCTRGHAGLHVCTDTHVHISHSGVHTYMCTQQAGSDTEAQRHMCVQRTHTSKRIWTHI